MSDVFWKGFTRTCQWRKKEIHSETFFCVTYMLFKRKASAAIAIEARRPWRTTSSELRAEKAVKSDCIKRRWVGCRDREKQTDFYSILSSAVVLWLQANSPSERSTWASLIWRRWRGWRTWCTRRQRRSADKRCTSWAARCTDAMTAGETHYRE